MRKDNQIKLELSHACRRWGRLDRVTRASFLSLVLKYQFSVLSGDLLLLNGRWYVTHSGLMGIAVRKHCSGISVRPVSTFSDPANARYAFKATVYKSRICRGFTGYGDANPSNVSPVVHGAEMRIAETRAVNRALRKAYGIGICSVEEIGSFERPTARQHSVRKLSPETANDAGNGHRLNGNGRVRDRLCQIIRNHNLDAELVKSYAVDFCGTKTLRAASREQVENFVVHLGDWAAKDRNALLCQLNSYQRPDSSAQETQAGAA